MKPLFIPLKSEYFDAFATGKKTVEYRKLGGRWNFDQCPTGRQVVLSKGYGKKHRLKGVIQYAWPIDCSLTGKIPGWKECYGDTYAHAIAIQIQLDT